MDFNDCILIAPGISAILFWLGYYFGFRAAKKDNVIIARADQFAWWK